MVCDIELAFSYLRYMVQIIKNRSIEDSFDRKSNESMNWIENSFESSLFHRRFGCLRDEFVNEIYFTFDIAKIFLLAGGDLLK